MIHPKDYAERALAAFNRRDLETLAGLWAADFHYAAPGEETHTREESLARERMLFAAFPDIVAKLRSELATSDGLAIEVTLEGTHQGPLRLGPTEIPATGRPVRVEFVAVFAFADGLARSERLYFDRVTLLDQL